MLMATVIVVVVCVIVKKDTTMEKKDVGDKTTPPSPSVHDQVPIPTVAKGSGEQPVEHTASASKTTKRRMPRYNQVVWMNDDEVKTIDFVAIRQKLRLYRKPPENLAINNRDQATKYYRSVGTFLVGGCPDRGYEDSEYYYYFWSDWETGLAKTSSGSGGAVSKKTLEIMRWISGNDATPPPPSDHDQAPVPTFAKGSGEQPQEPARKSRWPWDNRVIWMSDDEVKTIDFVAIRQRLGVFHKPPENLVINNRDQATEYYRSIGYFMQGGWPTRGYEDSDYYYYFWIDEETRLVKTVSGDAVSKKTLEIMDWYF
jgi:hypothetical protein